jgi:translation initiation factor 4G
MNANANAFVPGRTSKIVIKDESGRELNVGEFRKPAVTLPSVMGHGTRETRKSVIRMESPEAKREREEKEQAEREKKEREKREEEERKEKAKREEEERKKEEERKRKEEEERKVREEEERVKREEAERIRKEEEEKERIRQEEEAKERAKKEEEERIKREEEDRLRKEEEEKLRKEEEERIRLDAARKQEEADRLKKEEEEKASAAASEKEEGEVDETEELQTAAKDKSNLRIDTQVSSPTTPPPEHLPKRRPGPLDLSSAQKQNISQPLPSALATARIIEDISSISYPEGIKSPKIELNVNAKNGKFRYVDICTANPSLG